MATQQNQTNLIQTFQSPMGTELKVYVREGEPLFVGHEVAEALGYSNTRDALSRHVDSTDKTTVVIPDTGSNYKTSKVLINESGLYSLILSSKLPQAREFKGNYIRVVYALRNNKCVSQTERPERAMPSLAQGSALGYNEYLPLNALKGHK